MTSQAGRRQCFRFYRHSVSPWRNSLLGLPDLYTMDTQGNHFFFLHRPQFRYFRIQLMPWKSGYKTVSWWEEWALSKKKKESPTVLTKYSQYSWGTFSQGKHKLDAFLTDHQIKWKMGNGSAATAWNKLEWLTDAKLGTVLLGSQMLPFEGHYKARNIM
jgi:hypothetical protein